MEEIEKKVPEDETLNFEGDKEPTTETETKEPPKKIQSPKVNSYYAEKRRESEGKTYRDGVRETLKVNPYTGEEMKDDYDLEVYQEMKSLDEKGLDPLKEFSKVVASKNRARQEEEKTKQREKEAIAKDVALFNKKYPNVDISKMSKEDTDFIDYASGKWGNRSVINIYEGYMKLIGKNKKEVDIDTPTSQTKGISKEKSLKDMSEKEIHELYEKMFPRDY